MMNTKTDILTSLRVRLLPALLALVAVTTLTACAGPAATRPGDARLGAVSEEPIDISEYLIEGTASDGDGVVTVGPTTIQLFRNPHRDLLAISDAAGAEHDRITQYAALHLATCLAPPTERAPCWQRYASLFAELPACGAAALADAIDDDVMLAESIAGGISAECSVAYRARSSRSTEEYLAASHEHTAAQGWFDDDESLIMSARVRALAAGVLDAGASQTERSLLIQQLLVQTRGDLWEGQADLADRTFVGGRAEWRRKIEWARERALNAKLAYERGELPVRPVARLD